MWPLWFLSVIVPLPQEAKRELLFLLHYCLYLSLKSLKTPKCKESCRVSSDKNVCYMELDMVVFSGVITFIVSVYVGNSFLITSSLSLVFFFIYL